MDMLPANVLLVDKLSLIVLVNVLLASALVVNMLCMLSVIVLPVNVLSVNVLPVNVPPVVIVELLLSGRTDKSSKVPQRTFAAAVLRYATVADHVLWCVLMMMCTPVLA